MGGRILTAINIPRPRPAERAYSEFAYPSGPIEYIPVPRRRVAGPGFFGVLRSRRSRRAAGPLNDVALGTLLWHTSKTWESKGTLVRWEHRGVPSAGGCHPIDILITNRSGRPGELFWYDPIAHGLIEIPHSDGGELGELIAEMGGAAGREGTLLLYGAQSARTTSKYVNAESLIWRDAGVLTGVMTLVAEALGAHCTPLGPTGEPYVSRLVRSGGQVVGVGGCSVGISSRQGDEIERPMNEPLRLLGLPTEPGSIR
jgi:SagB-type dehydrogenase family enzyme